MSDHELPGGIRSMTVWRIEIRRWDDEIVRIILDRIGQAGKVPAAATDGPEPG